MLVAEREKSARGLRSLLSQRTTEVQVVAIVYSEEAVMERTLAAGFHVALVDATLPGLDCVRVARLVRHLRPEVAFVFLSASGQEERVRSFMAESPMGTAYFLKRSVHTPARLLRVLRDAADGLSLFDPAILRRLGEGSAPSSLTPRELKVLSLMAQAYSNAAIARALGIQPKTVGHHISSIFAKLALPQPGCHARVQAVLTYLSEGRAKA